MKTGCLLRKWSIQLRTEDLRWAEGWKMHPTALRAYNRTKEQQEVKVLSPQGPPPPLALCRQPGRPSSDDLEVSLSALPQWSSTNPLLDTCRTPIHPSRPCTRPYTLHTEGPSVGFGFTIIPCLLSLLTPYFSRPHQNVTQLFQESSTQPGI